MFVITGCQHHPPGHLAPDRWPEKPKSQGTSCPDISGTYYEVAIDSYSNIPSRKKNIRDSADELQTEINDETCKLKILPDTSNYRVSDLCSINAILNESYERSEGRHPGNMYLCPLSTMFIEQPDENTIKVTNHTDGRVESTYSLKKESGDFFCKDGKINITPGASVNTAPYSYRFQFFDIELFNDNDGSLVSNLTYTTRGMVIVVPFYEHISMGFRYKKVEQSDERAKLCEDLKRTIRSVDSNRTKSTQCPQISGKYYDRSNNSYLSEELDEAQNIRELIKSDNTTLCEVRGLERIMEPWAKDEMFSSCSLYYWIDPRHYAQSKFYGRDVIKKWQERVVEIRQPEITKAEIGLYGDFGSDPENFTIDMASEEFRCEDGNIVLYEAGDQTTNYHLKVTLFPYNDSLVLKSYMQGVQNLAVYPWYLPDTVPRIIENSQVLYHRWIRVDGEVNPYAKPD